MNRQLILRVNITKSDKFWLVEIPMLDAMTQGENEEDAMHMAEDWVDTMVGKPEFQCFVFKIGSWHLLNCNDDKALFELMKERLR